jgi:hypothetical protein
MIGILSESTRGAFHWQGKLHWPKRLDSPKKLNSQKNLPSWKVPDRPNKFDQFNRLD